MTHSSFKSLSDSTKTNPKRKKNNSNFLATDQHKISEFTSGENSGEDALIKRARSKVPYLIRMRKQTLTNQLRSTRWQTKQMNLKINNQNLPIQKKTKQIQTKTKKQSKDRSITSFSSFKLRVPVRKLVWSLSAFTSDIHLAWKKKQQIPPLKKL